MQTYDELVERAHMKGIRTFGDALDDLGIEGRDVFGSDYDEAMNDDYLYHCDAAVTLLEALAQAEII